MKTVSSVCATGSVTALSVVGLTIVSNDNARGRRDRDMTAIAGYPPLHNTFDRSFPFPTTQAPRFLSEEDDGSKHASNRRSTSSSDKRRTPQKRHSSSVLLDRRAVAVMEDSLRHEDHIQRAQTTSTQAPTWLRRVSNSVSTSRDSSRAASRPNSAAYSITNGSIAISHAGSTTPIFQDSTPPSRQRNRLVKRTPSTRSASGLSSPSSGSRLPIPTFRRPATSHQRSATFQDQLSKTEGSRRRSTDRTSPEPRRSPWRHYFTPRISAERLPISRRLSTTSIPNPIRRVYPDRKYTPTLVSARELVRPAAVEIEEDSSDREGDSGDAEPSASAISASSPLPQQTGPVETIPIPRRSFSFGDLLSTGRPASRRRPSSKGNLWVTRDSHRTILKSPQTTGAAMRDDLNYANGYGAQQRAKRRDLSNPREALRSVYSSASSSFVASHTDPEQEIDLHLGDESPFNLFTPDASMRADRNSYARTPSPGEQSRPPSTAFSSSFARPARLSASEITSTVGSDSEYRSVGDNSTDYQSDHAFDSVQTRATRSSSGRRGPHIETIFDESPTAFSSGRSTKLRDFLQEGQPSGGDHNNRFRHSIIEEEGSVMSTPVRSLHNRSVASTPSARPGAAQLFSSSPPAMVITDHEDIEWDAIDDDATYESFDVQRMPPSHIASTTVQSSLPFRFGPSLRPGNSRSANSTPARPGASPVDRANLFDWSEQQPSPSRPNHSPPRPRTVHGKKDQDIRGSRTAARRPVSGMHARSHSVPVVPDLDGNRSSVVANKFGTWGVGSKAVTEDWNEDFDFDEPGAQINDDADYEERRIDSGHEMFVPRSIREQQENVVANIGLLREWGLLIEELKELRIRAVSLGMLSGRYAQAWREVDAMIELADQETEEETLEPRRSPPSSPGFDYSLFEDTPGKAEGSRAGQPSASAHGFPNTSIDQDSRASGHETKHATRPRKDSELVAQTVIATLQSGRLAADTKKVPFDTATLRHIVPYVSGLKWRVKDALRETEGLHSSPHRRSSPAQRRPRKAEPGDTPLYSIFDDRQHESSPLRPHSRRQRAMTDNDEAAMATEQHADSSTR